MVQPELENSPRVLHSSSVWASTVELKRYQNGRWVTYIEIEVETKLPDGRVIKGEQLVSVQSSQEGRKDGRE